jgi:hypothetical protein
MLGIPPPASRGCDRTNSALGIADGCRQIAGSSPGLRLARARRSDDRCPFSFELRDELATMQAKHLLYSYSPNPRYGPQLLVTTRGERLEQRFRKTMRRHGPSLDWIAGELGNRGVMDPERLATAMWMTRQSPTARFPTGPSPSSTSNRTSARTTRSSPSKRSTGWSPRARQPGSDTSATRAAEAPPAASVS